MSTSAMVMHPGTGQTIWQDTANNLVWIKYKGGLKLSVWKYDGRSDNSLERVQIIRLQKK